MTREMNGAKSAFLLDKSDAAFLQKGDLGPGASGHSSNQLLVIDESPSEERILEMDFRVIARIRPAARRRKGGFGENSVISISRSRLGYNKDIGTHFSGLDSDCKSSPSPAYNKDITSERFRAAQLHDFLSKGKFFLEPYTDACRPIGKPAGSLGIRK